MRCTQVHDSQQRLLIVVLGRMYAYPRVGHVNFQFGAFFEGGAEGRGSVSVRRWLMTPVIRS